MTAMQRRLTAKRPLDAATVTERAQVRLESQRESSSLRLFLEAELARRAKS